MLRGGWLGAVYVTHDVRGVSTQTTPIKRLLGAWPNLPVLAKPVSDLGNDLGYRQLRLHFPL